MIAALSLRSWVIGLMAAAALAALIALAAGQALGAPAQDVRALLMLLPTAAVIALALAVQC